MTEAYVFELNETIYFDRESEIEEMLGVGLEPVITVEESGDTVSVRGVLELQGEYRKKKEVNKEIIIESSFVDRVEPLSDDINEFFHRFLIDVSLSREKVRNINDVVIEVSHFDYQLPSSGRMDIEAKLAIQGLVPFQLEMPVREESDLSLVTDDEENSIEEIEQFNLVYNHEENRKDTQPSEPPNSLQPTLHFEREIPNVFEVEAQHQISEQEIERKVSEEMVEHREEEKDTEETIETEETEETEEINEIEREETIDEDVSEEVSPSNNNPVLELVKDDTEAVNESELRQMDEEIDEEQLDEKVTVHGKSENRDDASYLMNIFKQEGEEDRTKLTIYIAQPDDNLNEIADKYKVSTSKLARINRLDDDWVANGQILYIPKKNR